MKNVPVHLQSVHEVVVCLPDAPCINNIELFLTWKVRIAFISNSQQYTFYFKAFDWFVFSQILVNIGQGFSVWTEIMKNIWPPLCPSPSKPAIRNQFGSALYEYWCSFRCLLAEFPGSHRYHISSYFFFNRIVVNVPDSFFHHRQWAHFQLFFFRHTHELNHNRGFMILI